MTRICYDRGKEFTGLLGGAGISVCGIMDYRGQRGWSLAYTRDVTTGNKCSVGVVIYVGQYMLFGDHILDLKIS